MMKKTIPLFSFLCLVIAWNVAAQTISIDDHLKDPGPVVIPVVMNDFVNVGAITLYFDYDPSVLTWDISDGSQNPAVPGLSVNSFPVPPDGDLYRVGITWSSTSGVDIDGVLVEVKFDYVGGSSGFDFFTPLSDIVDEELNPFDVTYIDGSIAPLTPPDDPDIAYVSIPHLTDQEPGNILVPLNVDFSMVETGVSAFNFVIQYDASVLSFLDIKNEALDDIDVFIISPSRISITYTNPDLFAETGSHLDGKLLDIEFDYTEGGSLLIFEESFCSVGNNDGFDVPAIYTNGSVNFSFDATATMPVVTADAGDAFSVPVMVTDFNNLGAITFNIEFNQNVIEYVGIDNVHPDLTANGDIEVNSIGGYFGFAWNFDDSDPPTYQGPGIEGKLFDIVFTMTGGNTDIVFAAGCEVAGADLDATPINVFYTHGEAIESESILLKVMLQGAYNPVDGVMRTSLRDAEPMQIPMVQPYGRSPWNYYGSETLPSPLSEDVVDWVLVELRDSGSDTYNVIDRSAALLKKDGSLIGTFTESTLSQFYLVVYHRNHLPVMYNGEIDVNDFTSPIDLTLEDNVLPGSTRILNNGVSVMVAGDVTASGQLAYTGGGNDRGPILFRIRQETGFTGDITDNITDVYFPEDVNLDNKVLYSGVGNDRVIILQNLQYFVGFNMLARYSTPVPGPFNSAKYQYYNDGPVYIMVDGNAIKIVTKQDIIGGLVDNIQFTLGWKTHDAEAEQAINNFASAFGIKQQGETVEVNGESFRAFVSVAYVELPHFWSKETGISVMEFDTDVTGKVWIAEDAPMEYPAPYYVSIWGEDNTGEVKEADTPTGIDDTAADCITVFPNPAREGIIHLVIPDMGGQVMDVAIYDLQGSLVKHPGQTTDNTEMVIDVSKLHGGVYIIRTSNRQMNKHIRFVIKR